MTLMSRGQLCLESHHTEKDENAIVCIFGMISTLYTPAGGKTCQLGCPKIILDHIHMYIFYIKHSCTQPSMPGMHSISFRFQQRFVLYSKALVHTQPSIIPGMHSISFKLQQRFVLYSNIFCLHTSKSYHNESALNCLTQQKGYLE